MLHRRGTFAKRTPGGVSMRAIHFRGFAVCSAFAMVAAFAARALEGGDLTLTGWTATGAAFAGQPVCGPLTTLDLRLPNGLPLARIGGNYWRFPVQGGFSGQ